MPHDKDIREPLFDFLDERAYLIYSGKLKVFMEFLKAISMPEELLFGSLHIPELPLRCL